MFVEEYRFDISQLQHNLIGRSLVILLFSPYFFLQKKSTQHLDHETLRKVSRGWNISDKQTFQIEEVVT